ncbi:hypothetical protein NLI96_g12092 [Meripilus lineatus]|uniref:Uncharacterized protein n=1 Tax=Meripilus lineatus TaxID=2056292 RepID=A0AAD5Y7W7_9APHY|nr:hypothetical protein NLI96_g12092 [Physisporinus lineatus]
MQSENLFEFLSQNDHDVQREINTSPNVEPDPVGSYSPPPTGLAGSPFNSGPDSDAGQVLHDTTLSEFASSPWQTASPSQSYWPVSYSTDSLPSSCPDSALHDNDVVTSSMDPCYLNGPLVFTLDPVASQIPQSDFMTFGIDPALTISGTFNITISNDINRNDVDSVPLGHSSVYPSQFFGGDIPGQNPDLFQSVRSELNMNLLPLYAPVPDPKHCQQNPILMPADASLRQEITSASPVVAGPLDSREDDSSGMPMFHSPTPDYPPKVIRLTEVPVSKQHNHSKDSTTLASPSRKRKRKALKLHACTFPGCPKST